MRTKISFLALIFLFGAFAAQAQHEETVLGNRNLGFSGIWGGTRHQISNFGNTNNYVNGWQFGLEFGRALLINFGGYSLHDDILWNSQANQRFDLSWRSFGLGYGFKNFKAVHPIVNIDAGRGKAKFEGEGEDRVFVIQPSAGVEINVFRWFHLGLEGGYRFVTDSDLPSLSDRELSGAYGQLSLKFGFSWGRYRKNDYK